MEESASLSKKAAKKADAEAKKEALKAQRALEDRISSAAATTELDEDHSKDRYGQPPISKVVFFPRTEEISLKDLKDEDNGKLVVLREWLQNSTTQNAKMGFVELREEGSWYVITGPEHRGG